MRVRKIKEFNRSECKRLDEAIQKELDKLENRFGVKLTRRNGSFGPSSYTFKIEAAVVSENGEVMSKMAQDFNHYAISFGLKPTDLFATFTSQGRTFKITGMKPQSYKFPIIAMDIDTEKSFKFGEAEIKRHLEKSGLVSA